MNFKSSSATHVGMVRKLNEDSLVERSEIGVWAVADGMGGHEAGDMASQTVVKFIEELPPAEGFDELFAAAKESLVAANRHLLEHSAEYSTDRVPGSTVVVLVIKNAQGAVLWTGDSRIYRQRDQSLSQLTRDHSHVQDLVDLNMIKAEDAESHPMANVITRALGISEDLEIESRLMEVRPGDQFLLCSDGLSRLASDTEIGSIMSSKNGDEIVHSLLHTALVRGAPDNVTLIHVQECDAEVDVPDEEDASDDDESTVVYDQVPHYGADPE
jgi:serine/threonine protein phosphatase PrpC